MRTPVKRALAVILGLVMLVATACNEADVVSSNLSQEADKFNILRRVIFYNGITNQYMLSIEGFCSLGNDRTANEISVTCKTGVNDEYKKHFLGLSDNVTYFVEQIDGANVSPDHYLVVFKPTVIVPDIEIR